jgi:hypothetical protein
MDIDLEEEGQEEEEDENEDGENDTSTVLLAANKKRREKLGHPFFITHIFVPPYHNTQTYIHAYIHIIHSNRS